MSIATAGNHTVIVYSNDTAGNIGQMSSNFTADMIISNLSGLGPAVNQPFSINLSSLNVGGGQTVTCTIGTNKTCYLEILGSCVTPTMVCSRAYTSTNAIINCSSLAGDSAMALWVSCNSSTQSWNSTPQNIFMDTDAPLFSVANFQGQNENFYARNLTGNWTILDSNLYRVNVTIDNTVAVFAQNEINQSSYSYNLTRTTTDLTPGLHTLKIQAWDSHTAKQIGSYDVSKPILSNAISFDTGTNNIEVVALDISGNVLNPWSTTKLQDRYTFSYKPEQTQSSYTFKVTTDQPIHIIERPDSIWKLWLVSGNNWIDFYTPESPGLVVGMVRVDDYTVEVTVALPEVIAEPIGKGGVVIEPAKDTIPLEDDKLNFYSIGDLNTASQNYTFYSYSITSTYNSQVAETENQTLSLLVQFTNNSQPNYNVSFSWNGTAYPITMVQNDTQRLFTVNFITPQIDGVTFSPTSYWTYNISNESNTITVTQQVVQIAIDNCSLYNYTALQVKFYDESSPTTGLVADLHLAITYWFNDPSVSKTFNMNFQGSNTYQVCMANSSYNYRTNLYAQYNTTGGYTHRYYLYNQSINGSIQLNLTMYNFQSQTGVSLLELTERDYLSNVYKQNIVTKLLRYYPGEGVWRTVQMDQSDIFGLTMFHILEQSTDYRLLFYDTNNTFIKQSDTVRFACTDAVCLNTILLQAPTTATTGDNLNLSWSYNSATGVISVPWNDLSGATDTVIMTVTKQTYTGPLTICNVTQIGSAGLMTCNTTGYTGAVFLNIETHSTVTKWVQHWIELAKTSLATTIGPGEGAFWTALIVITCVGFGLISPVIAIITAIIGLVAVYFLGIFSALTVPFIILAALLGIFIGYRVRN
jgi:hypothetical protein